MLHLMFPTHLSVGYLLGIYTRFPIQWLVLGSALPDLVDRPLYWLGLTPYTHTVAHSIAVAGPLCAVAIWLLGPRGAALAIGWFGHIGTDFLNVLTTKGLSTAAHYVLYFDPPPAGQDAFSSVTIPLPRTGIGHTIHPLLLLLESALLCWAVAALLGTGDSRTGVGDQNRSTHEPKSK